MSQDLSPALIAPRPGGRVFVFKEMEGSEGSAPRTIAFTNVDIKPRCYEELAAAKLHRPITIPLDMYNGRIIETNVEGVDISKYAHITATLESPFTARAIGLVRGGWLPSALAATKESAVVLPDRNIISEIVGRFNGGKKVGRESDFLDLFEHEAVKINPLLYAMEGNGRSLPEPNVACAQLDDVIAKLRRALPAATLMVGPETLTGLLGLIDESRMGMARKQSFLQRVAPTLSAPVARRHTDVRWAEVLAAADECGVSRGSLVALAVLSTLVNPQGPCAAKRLLKLHANYREGDAYNALCDLRSLDILLYCFAFFPEYDTQLCTADRNLALFWVGIGASGILRDGVGIRYTMTPHESVLPGEYGARWAVDVTAT